MAAAISDTAWDVCIQSFAELLPEEVFLLVSWCQYFFVQSLGFWMPLDVIVRFVYVRTGSIALFKDGVTDEEAIKYLRLGLHVPGYLICFFIYLSGLRTQRFLKDYKGLEDDLEAQWIIYGLGFVDSVVILVLRFALFKARNELGHQDTSDALETARSEFKTFTAFASAAVFLLTVAFIVVARITFGFKFIVKICFFIVLPALIMLANQGMKAYSVKTARDRFAKIRDTLFAFKAAFESVSFQPDNMIAPDV